MRRLWASWLCLAVVCGCDGATSVLVSIDPSGLQASSFTLAVALDDGRSATTELTGPVPSDAVVELAPVVERVTATAIAHLDGAGDVVTMQAIESVPHQRIMLTLRFDGAGATPSGAQSSDLSPAIDLAMPSDLRPLPPDMTTFLARDTFVRPNQAYWGTASDGQVWGADAQIDSNFSIANDCGVVTNTGTNTLQAVLGPNGITDADVRVQVSLDVTDQTQNGGPIIHRLDGANFYKAFLDGQFLVLKKRVSGTDTTLQMVSFTPTPGQFYWIRFLLTGTRLRAKAWAVNASEPSTWPLDQNDSSLTAGYVGLRIQAGAGSVRVREFMAQ